MVKDIKQINELIDQVADFCDSCLIIGNVNIQKDGKDGCQTLLCSRGNVLNIALSLRAYLEKNKEVVSLMKLLDLMPNFVSEELVEDYVNGKTNH